MSMLFILREYYELNEIQYTNIKTKIKEACIKNVTQKENVQVFNNKTILLNQELLTYTEKGVASKSH